MREHRVEVDHLRRLPFPSAHALDGIAGQQAHAPHDRPHLLIRPRPRQAILKQRGNQRLAFDQGHLAAQAGQYECVLAQPGSGIQHLRTHALGNAHRLGDHLPVATTEQAPMRGLAFDEVHPHRPRRLRAQLLNLQTINAHLHGKPGSIVLQRQLKALGPRSGLRLEFSRQRLDPDTCALLFHHSHLEIEPSH
ncbi:protein of unknown function [Pseudomonas inefficax]|uniref:Uncharacterized protein n=1 Tax=Pseudomonas inefficax TaxID=2078786 RepID=A0AAQ1P5H8_9PSED|nr:protein of unknown function [Pseudomonas inefficax]